MSLQAQKYERTGLVIDVHQSRDDQLQDLANNGLLRMLLDTGANRTIGEPSELNALLTGVVQSDIRVRGAFGSSAHAGDSFGTLPAYVIGNSGQIAVQHDFTVDTVPQTNQMLLAMSDMYNVGFDLHLRHKGPSGLQPHIKSSDLERAVELHPCLHSMHNKQVQDNWI
jgi:hypothetical protein